MAPVLPHRPSPWLAPLSVALVLSTGDPAQAGLLRPVLMLMRPPLENRLTRLCIDTVADGNSDLERRLQDPCRKLAGPTSRCLIEETDSSGRGLGVLSDLLAGRVGEDSEEVVKRCLARLFGLPADSLRDMPLRELARRFLPRQELLPGDAAGAQELRR